jgi:threonyl-tRNA synthetase
MASEVTVTVNGQSRAVARGTRVREVLSGIPSKDLIAARLDDKIVDLSRPIESDATVAPVFAESPEGLDVIRHSTAHLMAMAVQQLYPGTQVTIGPVIEDGFYYDFAPRTPFTVEDLPKIEAKMKELAKADFKVERTEVPRAEAIKTFGAMGGPHVPSTRYLRAFKLLSVAGAYWRGDEHNEMLSRIYGTSFASKEALEEHLKLLELARARDHRKLGRDMELYFFDPVSPGMPFYLPRGMVIFNELLDYMRRLYRRYGFQEVVTPLIYKNQLWNQSGHWDNFRENMFLTPDPDHPASAIDTGTEGWRDGYGVKPMNCPGHTVLYRADKRSYRDLPLRYAEFSRLHRAERSGTLHGMTRVRVMSQDDGHIFCTEEQIEDEVAANLAMVREVYAALGFEQVEYKLATMPDQHLGTEEQWRASEEKLGNALRRNGIEFTINPKEGAFYGPKIEFYVPDALKRKWQLATIQLDPNLPERFDLKYTNRAGAEERPVMIHRAILGSLERFIGVLIEHTGGVLPFWLAPEQVRVLSLSEKVEAYAKEVTDLVRGAGYRGSADLRNEKLGFKVREAELAKVPYMIVVGEREAAERTVSVRRLRGSKGETYVLQNLLEILKQEPLPA